MCEINYYTCGCCEKRIDQLSSKCRKGPENMLKCKKLEERVSRAMYCESCGEDCVYKKHHLLIAKWRQFKGQLKALKKAIVERCEHNAKQRAIKREQRKCKAQLKACAKAHPMIGARADQKVFEKARAKKMAERRAAIAYLKTLGKDELEAIYKARDEAREKAREKAIIDQLMFRTMQKEFARGW